MAPIIDLTGMMVATSATAHTKVDGRTEAMTATMTRT